MSLNTARANIFTYIQTNWSDCDVLYQGQQITDTYIKRQTPWMYAMIKWGSQLQHSMPASNAYFATLGIIQVKIYTREKDGAAVVDELTDALFTLFRVKQINNVQVTELNINSDENSKGWNIRSVAISFILRTIENIP